MPLERLKFERQKTREKVCDVKREMEISRARANEIDDMDQSDVPEDFRLDSGFTWMFVQRCNDQIRALEAELQTINEVIENRLT